jgi:hypothetical protein
VRNLFEVGDKVEIIDDVFGARSCTIQRPVHTSPLHTRPPFEIKQLGLGGSRGIVIKVFMYEHLYQRSVVVNTNKFGPVMFAPASLRFLNALELLAEV